MLSPLCLLRSEQLKFRVLSLMLMLMKVGQSFASTVNMKKKYLGFDEQTRLKARLCQCALGETLLDWHGTPRKVYSCSILS